MKLSRVAAIAAVSVVALSVPASANHSWNGYHWATTGSGLTVKVNASISGQWPTYVDGAITDWEKSNVLSLGQRLKSTADAKKCSPIAGQVQVCNASYGQRGWLGIASIWLTNNHISQATTKLNDTYFNMARYNTPAWRAMVACQEIGHDWGLDHQDENFSNTNLGTCMDYTNDPAGTAGTNGAKSNQHPNQHDYDQLLTTYNHNDGSTTATASTNFGIRQVGKPVPEGPASSDDAGNSPAEWGRAIHTDSLGRPDVFEKVLGPKDKVITHVFWALETKRANIE